MLYKFCIQTVAIIIDINATLNPTQQQQQQAAECAELSSRERVGLACESSRLGSNSSLLLVPGRQAAAAGRTNC